MKRDREPEEILESIDEALKGLHVSQKSREDRRSGISEYVGLGILLLLVWAFSEAVSGIKRVLSRLDLDEIRIEALERESMDNIERFEDLEREIELHQGEHDDLQE